ncbi:MAG: 23S rRNA (cytosine(1962)-C(5))-methyltransferase RlmI [Anaerolineae bacterium]
MSYPTVTLKPGRERSVVQRHPWIFSGAIATISDGACDGNVVDVRSAQGEWLARGVLNRRSQITVRILTWEEGEPIDERFWRRRLETSLARRAPLTADEGTDSYRLVFSESDGLPGLIVDRYGDWLVAQFSAWAAEVGRATLVEALRELVPARGLIERVDAEARKREGLPLQEGLIWGEEPPELIEIRENGHRFLVDVREGQKTGFFLDQRRNRAIVGGWSGGARVLNGFAYTGGFGVYALAAGAEHVINVDSSYDALVLAERAFQLNGFTEERYELIQANMFELLRDYRARGEQFDLIILDPPKFATRQSQLSSATRGYKDINLLAMQLLRPGGILATFSCSGVVSIDLFQKIIWGASLDAGRVVQIIERLGQGLDHPILLTFPESEYLKGLLCRVD